MIRAVVATAALLAVVLRASAADSTFEPVGPAYSFDFDTPDGHYEYWNSPIVCPVNALLAAVQFKRYGKPTTEFSPGVNAYLYLGKEPKYAKLGFHATVFHPPFLVTMSSGDAKSVRPGPIFAREVGYTDRFSFELHWDSDGTVRASVDGQSGIVHMPEAPDRVHIMGFSGAGKVLVQLGYIKGNDKKDPCRPIA